MDTFIIVTFIAVVLCIPLFLLVVNAWRPLKANADATSFTGKYRGWHLTHVTGKVLASRRHTETHGSGSVYGSASSGTVSGSSRISTDVHDTLNLQRADGGETDVEVVNFNVSARPGSVVSIWTAVKGNRWFTFAVLNHTTNQQTVNQAQVRQIMGPRGLIGVYLVLLVFPIVFFSFFGGACVPLVLFLVLVILFAGGQKQVRSRFNSSGISAIWDRSRSEARPILAQ